MTTWPSLHVLTPARVHRLAPWETRYIGGMGYGGQSSGFSVDSGGVSPWLPGTVEAACGWTLQGTQWADWVPGPGDAGMPGDFLGPGDHEWV